MISINRNIVGKASVRLCVNLHGNVHVRQTCITYGPRKLLIWPSKPHILFILLLSLKKTPFEWVKTYLPLDMSKKSWTAMRFELCTPDVRYYRLILNPIFVRYVYFIQGRSAISTSARSSLKASKKFESHLTKSTFTDLSILNVPLPEISCFHPKILKKKFNKK